ncbi:DNA cytosine methyltransferase [Campylobacter curvus]|uniref:DNA cytosine methyltransferase n=1 Tax=Campylobacter curvus TaxID=200 RepID=UPI0014702A2D|nr:DNA (cytosine-5-)-methyltransferase [Campylobacter curvus]
MASEKIALATIFSGIGAAEFAVREVFDKHETLFACEIDKFARQSYMANHEIKHFYRDIKELDAKIYANKVDILVGGSPCQDFSIAGERKGVDGERGGLIYEFLRIVDECKPKVFIYENVKGFLSISKGRAYVEFKMALRDMGYYIHDGILNTKDYGIAQNRERIYIVGFLDFDEYLNFDFAGKMPLTTTIKDYLDDEVDEKYYLSDKALAHLKSINPKFNGKFRPKNDNEPFSNTITTNPGHRRTNTFIKVVGKLDTKGKDSTKRIYSTNGLAPTLDTFSGGNRATKIKSRERIRKLTPKECLRLQGFPESFEIVCSDTQIYKQAGNAMSVNVVAMILRQIQKIKEGVSDSLFAKAAV